MQFWVLLNEKTSEKSEVYQISWLGRLDSNQRMSAPKADALPLGDAPMLYCGKLVCCKQGIFYDKKNIIASVFFANVKKSD